MQGPLVEWVIRAGAFAAVFLALVLWEARAPRRARTTPRSRRWPGNLGVLALDAALVRLLVPAGAIGAALLAGERGWGLLNVVALPRALEIVLAVLLLDLAIWAQHVLFHALPPLWRLHRMHHADPDLDVTTGLRFHPLEILLSALVKLGVVVVIGAEPLAVLVFEVLLNAASMFNHGNVRLQGPADRVLRWVIVTPDMHRVHHSWHRDETDSNYGFCLPWWDRLFGTYRAEPRDGHERMTLGLGDFRDPAELRLGRMLLQPFVGPARPGRGAGRA
jgi:sterol desaturase/sphingolipid hydroxylase (fatty acid hydroxylase superfamily)